LSFVVALNDREIFSQALVFLVAGYETTSVLMSFVFYIMATEPFVQERVYEEILDELADVLVIHIGRIESIVDDCLPSRMT
jgi:cytochrome P450